MSIKALLAGFAAIGLGFAGTPAEGMMEGYQRPPQTQVRCRATGAKLFVPAMTPEAICARFSAAVAAGLASGESVSVDLKFLPNGVATAVVTRTRAGKASAPVEVNLAVSDRGFGVRDVDRLAANVATALRKGP
ncbi:MAG: hypothetical protein E7773_09570 [Sphingomonas sp.]|uniref:hypothetical protein n=1 Tax=Sphingomonas sp. TaxID=28214 RepID=UPI0011FC8044|nr:hypothetical protein [Sphingomonas sp.]THD36162.1 MAG: hypothetical protein E7773_09570 [Sphingomonas sp.]